MGNIDNRLRKLERRFQPQNTIRVFALSYGYEKLTDDKMEQCPKYQEQLTAQKDRDVQIFHIYCQDCEIGCNQPLKQQPKQDF